MFANWELLFVRMATFGTTSSRLVYLWLWFFDVTRDMGWLLFATTDYSWRRANGVPARETLDSLE